MKTLLRDPLAHFLLIGALMFVAYAWTQRSNPQPSRDRIVVTEGRIRQLVTLFEKTWQRPPNPDELRRIVDDFVLEEVYYRQAVKMGIDRDDTIIRRRLRQKLEFLSEDAASLVSATDEELGEYLAEHPEAFRESPRYTFEQVYFNPDKHGDSSEAWFTEQRELLESGETEIGDPSLIPAAFDDAPQRVVDGAFGIGFAEQLDEIELKSWQGPIRSGLGLHLVRLDHRTDGRLPGLEEIRPIVQREWSNDQRLAARDLMNRELLDQYDVVIDWQPEEISP